MKTSRMEYGFPGMEICTANRMEAYDMGMQGSRASVVMILI